MHELNGSKSLRKRPNFKWNLRSNCALLMLRFNFDVGETYPCTKLAALAIGFNLCPLRWRIPSLFFHTHVIVVVICHKFFYLIWLFELDLIGYLN